MKTPWITNDLKKEVRKVFEPRYKRALTECEVEEIAENLAGVTTAIFKFQAQRYNEAIVRNDKLLNNEQK